MDLLEAAGSKDRLALSVNWHLDNCVFAKEGLIRGACGGGGEREGWGGWWISSLSSCGDGWGHGNEYLIVRLLTMGLSLLFTV